MNYRHFEIQTGTNNQDQDQTGVQTKTNKSKATISNVDSNRKIPMELEVFLLCAKHIDHLKFWKRRWVNGNIPVRTFVCRQCQTFHTDEIRSSLLWHHCVSMALPTFPAPFVVLAMWRSRISFSFSLRFALMYGVPLCLLKPPLDVFPMLQIYSEKHHSWYDARSTLPYHCCLF